MPDADFLTLSSVKTPGSFIQQLKLIEETYSYD